MGIVRCRMCRRLLKNALSKRRGVGRGCARKNPGLAYQIRVEAQGQMRLPFKD